jgi:hypothetical protein
LRANQNKGFDPDIAGYFDGNDNWLCPLCTEQGGFIKDPESSGYTPVSITSKPPYDVYCHECGRWIPLIYSDVRQHEGPHLVLVRKYFDDENEITVFVDENKFLWSIFADEWDPTGCVCCNRPLNTPGLAPVDFGDNPADLPHSLCSDCVVEWDTLVQPSVEP